MSHRAGCQCEKPCKRCDIITIVTRRLAVVCACLLTVGCSQPSPSPPPTPDPGSTGPSGPPRITGAERIAWDQQAGSTDELAAFHYLIYMDSVGTEVQGVSCIPQAGSALFGCSGQLPSMLAGPHALALSSYTDSDGVRVESLPSETLNVEVVPQAATTAAVASIVTTLDGIQLRASMIADGLNEPTDLSFASDGRIFIAERGGRVLVFRDGHLQPAPALTLPDATTADGQGLLAMAVDPGYEQNHFVYIVYTASSGFRLARFRGVGDTLGDRAILMEGIACRSARPAAALRFGPDGKLYTGLDDGGNAFRAGDLGSFNGKILRLNADATTPADQAGGTPVYAAHVTAPRGVDWDASGATLWVVEDAASGSGGLQAVVAADTRERRGTTVTRYSLPEGAGVAALTFYRGALIPEFRGDLLLAADGDHTVLRLRFDAADPLKVVATERLLWDSLDGARTIGVGRDGAIYLCAAHTLMRLAPAAARDRIPLPSPPGTL
jgi:glucose/arabinose dehydrogenase